MKVNVTSGTRGEVRAVDIHITSTEWELVDLIDCLAMASGPAQIIAGAIAKTVGLVDVRSDANIDMARTLRRFADLLESRPGER